MRRKRRPGLRKSNLNSSEYCFVQGFKRRKNVGWKHGGEAQPASHERITHFSYIIIIMSIILGNLYIHSFIYSAKVPNACCTIHFFFPSF